MKHDCNIKLQMYLYIYVIYVLAFRHITTVVKERLVKSYYQLLADHLGKMKHPCLSKMPTKYLPHLANGP